MTIEIESFSEGSTEPLAFPTEETEDVELIPRNPEKTVKIGSRLEEPLRTGLVELLRVYANIFAWVPSNMLGIDESVVMHRLCVDSARKPVR